MFYACVRKHDVTCTVQQNFGTKRCLFAEVDDDGSINQSMAVGSLAGPAQLLPELIVASTPACRWQQHWPSDFHFFRRATAAA